MNKNPKEKFNIKLFFEKYVKILIPYDFYHVFNNFYYILKDKNNIYIYLWVFFSPLIFIYCVILLLLAAYYIIYYYIILLYNLFLRKKAKQNKKNFFKKIKYKKIKVLSNNEYTILIKKSFLEKSSEIGFNFFYYINNFIINWKKNKKEMNINTTIYLLYVILFRFLFYFLTHVPFFFFKINTLLIKKIQTTKELNFENPQTKLKFIWFNFLIDININIEYKIKKMRIIIKKNKIIFNPLNYEFLAYLKTKITNLNLLKNSILDLSENINIATVKHIIKNDINIKIKKLKEIDYNELEKREVLNFENQTTTKPHLTAFFSINNKFYYKNETNKDSLWIYDKQQDKFIELKLKYNHLGSLNKKLNTLYTPTIETDKKLIITEKNLAKVILNTKNQIIAKHNLSTAFLLDSDEKLLKTEYLKEKNQYVITKTSVKTLTDERKNLELNDNQILDCFKKWNDFMEENKEIINKIPNGYLDEFISDCLYERINDFKETTFFLLKK